MKKLGCGIFFLLLIFGIAQLIYSNLMDNPQIEESTAFDNKENLVEEDEKQFSPKQLLNKKTPVIKQMSEEGLHLLIGQSANYVKEKYGSPIRIDPSSYDYEWWVYSEAFQNGYIQIGIEDDKVVTVFCIGSELPTANIQLGATYSQIKDNFEFQQDVSFSIRNNSYQFKLTDEELESRPLLYIDGIFIQLYFDTFTKTLSSIRYMDAATLVKHRPYSVVYRGELIVPKELTNDEWREVEKGSALQIFAITNEIRKGLHLTELNWDEQTSVVAFYHSKDMKTNEYFSHSSPENGELKDRLKKQGVLYQLAGENIAAKYVDGIAAVEGWLNSEGHRVNLLHEDFTHLGVGVYENYYTQNFITPWQ